MSKAIRPAALALAASLSLFAACKAIDEAERTGPANNKPADKAANATRPTPATAGDHEGHDHAQDVARRINIDEARSAVERGEAVFVDVRGDDAFRTGRIAGSVSVPSSEIASRAVKLPKDKLLITYCA